MRAFVRSLKLSALWRTKWVTPVPLGSSYLITLVIAFGHVTNCRLIAIYLPVPSQILSLDTGLALCTAVGGPVKLPFRCWLDISAELPIVFRGNYKCHGNSIELKWLTYYAMEDKCGLNAACYVTSITTDVISALGLVCAGPGEWTHRWNGLDMAHVKA